MDGRVLSIVQDQFVEVRPDSEPVEAVAPVRCDPCGAVTIRVASITYRYYDDDHVGRFELRYESRHTGRCSECGAALDVELRYTHRGEWVDRLGEFARDGVDAKRGNLASAEGIPVPKDALRHAEEDSHRIAAEHRRDPSR